MMNYGIAILPNKKIQQLANSYRKRYDPHYKLIVPHITLHEKSIVSSEDELQALIQSLSDVAQTTPAFTLSISKYGTFHPVNNVIYLALDECPAIYELHKKLMNVNSFDERPYAFTPHITIAQKMDTDELLDVYAGIKRNNIAAEFIVDQFHLFKQDEDQAWSIFKTVELKGN